MSIFLIRHGQTNGNRDRVLQTPDTPLSELGHQQAQLLSMAFADIQIGQIMCSDYTRTQQTVGPMRLLTTAKFTLAPILRERSFGDLRGKAYDDIDADFFHPHYAPPNGETHQDFIQRVSRAWLAILSAYDNTQGNLVVMTHGLVLRELINQHLQITEGVKALSDFQNTCITRVDGNDRKTIRRLCDASHLGNLTTVGAAV